jgi:hypothetical protein
MDIISFKEQVLNELSAGAEEMKELDPSDLGLISGGQIEPAWMASGGAFSKS